MKTTKVVGPPSVDKNPENILLLIMYDYISTFVSYEIDRKPYSDVANEILDQFPKGKQEYNYYELIMFVEMFFDRAKGFINSHLGDNNQMTFELFVQEINNMHWMRHAYSSFHVNEYSEEQIASILSTRGRVWQRQIEHPGIQQQPQSAGKKNNIVRRKNNIVRRKNVGKLSRKQKHKQRKYKKTNKKYN